LGRTVAGGNQTQASGTTARSTVLDAERVVHAVLRDDPAATGGERIRRQLEGRFLLVVNAVEVDVDTVGQVVRAIDEQARALMRRHQQVYGCVFVLVGRRGGRTVVDEAVVVRQRIGAARARRMRQGTAAVVVEQRTAARDREAAVRAGRRT